MNNLPRRQPSVSARIGQFIVHAAAIKGVTTRDISHATGFDPVAFPEPDARIRLSLETQLWNTAAMLSNDADFGLHVAEMIHPGAFDVFDYAVRTAPDLGDALNRMVRYNRLVHDLAVFDVVERAEVICIEHRFKSPDIRPCRQASEFTLASLLVIGGQMTGLPLKPTAVSFAHHRPDRVTEHLRIFGVMPEFGAAVTSLTLPRSVLAYTIPDADPGLSRIVTAHAEQLLASTAYATVDIAATVRGYLAEDMAQGPKTLSEIAQRMHLSERSLQRRLESEGTGFARLVDEVRKELALRYIADRRLALGEVAYLLGFAELSPFHRAFKRWTGMTPAAARLSFEQSIDV